MRGYSEQLGQATLLVFLPDSAVFVAVPCQHPFEAQLQQQPYVLDPAGGETGEDGGRAAICRETKRNSQSETLPPLKRRPAALNQTQPGRHRRGHPLSDPRSALPVR